MREKVLDASACHFLLSGPSGSLSLSLSSESPSPQRRSSPSTYATVKEGDDHTSAERRAARMSVSCASTCLHLSLTARSLPEKQTTWANSKSMPSRSETSLRMRCASMALTAGHVCHAQTHAHTCTHMHIHAHTRTYTHIHARTHVHQTQPATCVTSTRCGAVRMWCACV